MTEAATQTLDEASPQKGKIIDQAKSPIGADLSPIAHIEEEESPVKEQDPPALPFSISLAGSPPLAAI